MEHMIKVRVHIFSEGVFCDSDVFVDIFLPAIPRKGETLFLSDEHEMQLLEMAQKTIKHAEPYFPKYFYYRSQDADILKTEILKDLSFDGCVNVFSVSYNDGEDLVHIELET